jgi:hypothetical protein
MRRLFTTVLILLATLGLASGSVSAGESKLKAFDLLQTRSDKHEIGDAYLLATASCYIFPELLGVKDRNDHEGFTKQFADKFFPLGIKKVQYVADLKSGTEAVVMSNDSAVIVVFRGSEISECKALVKDWLTNLNACLTKTPELGKGVKVHRGMWKSLDRVYAVVVKDVEEQGGFGDKRLYVTGHSLGGGLALLCGVRLQVEGKGKPIVYTFGAPRTGNFEFRQAARDLVVHRWVNNKDVVPMLPSDRFYSYRHVGLTHNIKKSKEVYLDDSETRAVCGSSKEHHVYRYLEGLYANLPDELKGQMPVPPTG